MILQEREQPGELVDFEEGLTAKTFLFLARAKGGLEILNRLWEIGERFGFFDTESSKRFSEKFVKLSDDNGIPRTIMLSAGHIPDYPELAKYYSEAGKKGTNFGCHGWVHEAHSLLSEEAQREIVLGSKEVLELSGINPEGWRAPRYQNGPGTDKGIFEAGYLWDASSTILLWPKEFKDLTPTRSNNLRRSIALSGPRSIHTKLAVPEIYSSQEGSFVKFFTILPDDEMLQNRVMFNGTEKEKSRAAKVMIEMVNFTRQNMELFVQQFHPERIYTYYNQLKACFEEINRKGDVQLSTPSQMAEWWKERGQVTFNLIKDGSDQFVEVKGPERGRVILIQPQQRPSDQTVVYGYRKTDSLNGFYPGIGLKGTPENIELAKKILNDFLTEPFRGDQNYAYTINADKADLVFVTRDIISGNVNYPIVMRSRFTPKPNSDQVYTWAYLLIGDICQFTLKDVVIDTLRQGSAINRAYRFAR